MLYTYCKKELNFKRIKTSKLLKVLLGVVIFATLGFTVAINNATDEAFETELEEIRNKVNSFASGFDFVEFQE